MKLKEYNQKRNFKKTSEPKGKTRKKNGRIFVVQYHRAKREHYDFRLEWRGVLLSWAVPKGLSNNPKDKRLAVHVEDHPIEYANFEGMIPKGEYGGGSVLVWDRGVFEPENDFDKGLETGTLKFRLFGQRAKGAWTLVRLKDDDNWLIIKERDELAEEKNTLSNYDTSVLSGRASQQIIAQEDLSLKKNPFDWADVQLASLATKIPTGKDWLFEIKYDGYRVLTFAQNGKVKFFSRNKSDFTQKFKVLALELENWSKHRAFVLDGELVVLDQQGRSDFQALQNYMKSKADLPLVYMIFDLLALDGEDLRDLPLEERKDRLRNFLKDAPESFVYSEHVVGRGEDCFEAAQKMGLEGVVGKVGMSKYSGERNGDWVKIKCRKRQEFVVGGYSRSAKKKTGISSLLLGAYEKENFVYYGRAGTGLRETDQKKLLRQFDKLEIRKSAFNNNLNPEKDEQIFWIKPKVVVEIEYAEITSEKLLRQASFKGVRTDKNAKDVVLENFESDKSEITEKNKSKRTRKAKSDKLVVAGVEISNPDKVLFKDCEVTKLDVVNYYLAVSERMLKYMKNRILSVVRCHGQVSKENSFFKKHPSTESKGVKIVEIENSEGDKSEYFCVENVSGIVSQAQLGTIEFHTWGSLVENLEKPDLMVFDLDPDEGMKIEDVRRGVKDLKKVLDELSLKAFLKTSGGKGYHVIVPFKPNADWQAFHDFAQKLANLMESKWPERYTSNMRKDCRKGKIFIDWVRNGRGATSVAGYSLRARAGAKVSMPIFWSELDKVLPNQFDIFNSLERVKKKDPWAELFKIKQELK